VSYPLTVTFCLAILAPSAFNLLVHAQQAETAGHPADEAAIKAIVAERWMGGWNAHDAHQFSSVFAEDADFTNVRGQSASGQAEIEKFHAVAFEQFFKQSHQTASCDLTWLRLTFIGR
jgi:ketosteroid isomerase-like protein